MKTQGRYVPGLANRSVLSDWLRIRSATHSTSLMQFKSKNDILKCTLEEAVNNGDLSKQQYALMKDRILMDEGKPQIYGSQIKNGKLYKLEAPEKVNERRAEMEMGSIEDYLKSYNIEFKIN